ncbi:Secreted repeat of unknown function [Amycolatopsis lurida]|uniref:Lipoprotein n=2 Tax=Amycolatopsis lurida TaxID=31959 RepID=A0A2P2FRW9_AMYLU|nr:lipoprotein [Amycolatopsis lurida NRRL 2430]SED19781.1 Secreted repeat of unknown function [Amycolatopsis lurida]
MLVVVAVLVVGAAMWWQAAEPVSRTARAPVTEALPSPRPSAPAGTRLTAVHLVRMGQAVLDETGAVLFRYERDNPHEARSACLGDCAIVWTPVTTKGTPPVTGIDPALIDTIKRPEGTEQVTLAGRPLYKAATARPGEWTGQGTGHVWFVVRPDGRRNLNCLPGPVQ